MTTRVFKLLRGHGASDLGCEFWSYPQSRTLAELMIDCEEDKPLRAVLVGMLRVMQGRG